MKTETETGKRRGEKKCGNERSGVDRELTINLAA